MSKRYTYSRSIDVGVGPETFTAVEFDSFDEARKAVERGIHDRKLEFRPEKPASNAGIVGGLGARINPGF